MPADQKQSIRPSARDIVQRTLADYEDAEMRRLFDRFGVTEKKVSDDTVAFIVRVSIDRSAFGEYMNDVERNDDNRDLLESSVVQTAQDAAPRSPKRRTVKRTIEECEAENKATCRFHGISSMESFISDRLKKQGCKTGSVSISEIEEGCYALRIECIDNPKEKNAACKAIAEFLNADGIDEISRRRKPDESDYMDGGFSKIVYLQSPDDNNEKPQEVKPKPKPKPSVKVDRKHAKEKPRKTERARDVVNSSASIAPHDGESVDDYLARMEQEGKPVPASLMKLSEIEADRRQKWMEKAGVTQQEYDTIQKNLAISIKRMFDKIPVGMNVDSLSYRGIPIIKSILNSHVKSLFETGDGRGCTDQQMRADGENIFFGLPKDPNWNREERPKYGCACNGSDPMDIRSSGSPSYGVNYISFKKDKTVCTISAGDSLNIGYFDENKCFAPTFLTNPQPTMLSEPTSDIVETLKHEPVDMNAEDFCNDAGLYSEYIEIQFHSMLTADSIDGIYFYNQKHFDESQIGDEEMEIIRRNGIHVYVEGKRLV